MHSIREFRLVAQLWGRLILALASTGASAASLENRVTFSVLHTNDLHGHIRPWIGWEGELEGRTVGGFDRLAAAIKRVRSEVSNVIVLDAGDTVGDTMIAHLTEGRAMITLMNAVGYDAMAIGNHEVDATPQALRDLIEAAKFPVLAANVVVRGSSQPLAQPHVMRDIAGVKVGIFGLAYPNTPLTTAKKNTAKLEFGDPLVSARRIVPELKSKGAQIIIALTHLGLGADKKLAEAVPEISVIVGGHSHNRMTEALRVNDTLIVQAGAHGSDLGRLDLTVANGRVVAHQRTLITLDNASIPSDAPTAALMGDLEKPFRSQLDEVVGEATMTLPRAQTLAGQEPRKRDEPSPVDELFAAILREKTRSDLALLPGVGYGVALQRGPISAEALRNLVPHDSKVVVVTLTGKQILEILEQAVENTFSDDPHTKVGGMIQVSGLRFQYQKDAPNGKRVRDVAIGDAPIDHRREYRVATNSMLAAGGHNYRTFLAGRARTEHGKQYEMIKTAIQGRPLGISAW